MQNNKYVKLHSLLRMFAALLALVVFISMFAMGILGVLFGNPFLE